jgi:sugar phosphate permease
MAMIFHFWFSRAILTTYLQVYAKVSLNFSDAEVASFTVYMNFAIMLIRFLSATILAKLPFRPTLIAFLVINGISGLIAPYTNTYAMIVLVFFLSGTSYGAVRIFETVSIANISTSENRGIANSSAELSASMGNLAKIATTPIVEVSGIIPTFILGGVISFCAAIPPLLHRVADRAQDKV